MTKIGLCMIVKNERHVILNCLQSVRSLIDYVLIEDTGSTDGTQQLVRDWLLENGIPGEVIEEPWQNFAYNRSHALAALRKVETVDYALMIDADSTLVVHPDCEIAALKAGLSADAYELEIRSGALSYYRQQVCSNRLAFNYRGVLHEFLAAPEGAGRSGRIAGVHIADGRTGARSQNPRKYHDDAAVLAKALETETDPFLISRYTFYLAQNLQDSGQNAEAYSEYLKRTQLGFCPQEIYISYYRAAQLAISLERSDSEILGLFEKAIAVDPTRAEAFHGAARYCRINKLHQQGFNFAKKALSFKPRLGALFIEKWIYDYGLLDEYAVNAYWIEEYKECYFTCQALLKIKILSESTRKRIEANANFAKNKIDEQNKLFDIEKNKINLDRGPFDEKSENIIKSTDQKINSNNRYVHKSATIHIIGVAHTVPNEDYTVCAFTGKVLIFPDVIQPFGWDVVEYSNEGSESSAREHIVILTRERLASLSKRKSRDEPFDADVNNLELKTEFQRILVEKIKARARPGDIVCHVWGPNMDVYNELRSCHHVELSVGYSASPGLPFRVYESSAWMHVHYERAKQYDGSHYKWVIPSAFDCDKWTFRAQPDGYAVYLGRITKRKGMNTLVEIARRMPELQIRAYGPGDPTQWSKDAPPNLVFLGPVFGDEKVRVIGGAKCMLMPTDYIEPFGFSGVEAQLCGVPLIATSYGAFQETIEEGVSGYRCHTLADWVAAINLSSKLDRRVISDRARKKYSKEVIGKQYNWVFQQISDLKSRGWYGEISRKFAEPLQQYASGHFARIWLYMPFYGDLPNYFQLYLDSLARNSNRLSVIMITDQDLSSYRLPENLVIISMTMDEIRERAARLLKNDFNISVQAIDLIKKPYKLCDLKVTFPELFHDLGKKAGVSDLDYVGWGDCDLIYGRFDHFLSGYEDYEIIGGYHGHLTAFRNNGTMRGLYRSIVGFAEMLIDENNNIIDEIGFRKPLQEFISRNPHAIFYTNRYFCDVVPECFWGRFRKDFSARSSNFFDVYNHEKNINFIRYGCDGKLTVIYEDLSSREALYCHLQKRPMMLNIDIDANEYEIYENEFIRKL